MRAKSHRQYIFLLANILARSFLGLLVVAKNAGVPQDPELGFAELDWDRHCGDHLTLGIELVIQPILLEIDEHWAQIVRVPELLPLVLLSR